MQTNLVEVKVFKTPFASNQKLQQFAEDESEVIFFKSQVSQYLDIQQSVQLVGVEISFKDNTHTCKVSKIRLVASKECKTVEEVHIFIQSI